MGLWAANAGTPGGRSFDHPKLVVVDGRTAAPLFLQRLRLFAGMADMDDLPVGVEAAIGVFSE